MLVLVALVPAHTNICKPNRSRNVFLRNKTCRYAIDWPCFTCEQSAPHGSLRHPVRYSWGMTLSTTHHRLIPDCGGPVADVLLVHVPAAAIGAMPPELFSHVESGREALGMLKLLRFHLLLASLDVPDMRPWELFQRARRSQSRLQCVLLDERMSLEDEQRVRQTG